MPVDAHDNLCVNILKSTIKRMSKHAIKMKQMPEIYTTNEWCLLVLIQRFMCVITCEWHTVGIPFNIHTYLIWIYHFSTFCIFFIFVFLIPLVELFYRQNLVTQLIVYRLNRLSPRTKWKPRRKKIVYHFYTIDSISIDDRIIIIQHIIEQTKFNLIFIYKNR